MGTEPIKIQENLYYLGVNDRQTEYFENMWPLPYGVAYNSYLLTGEKTCLMDTVKVSKSDEFVDNVKAILKDRKLDYLVIHHIEPDHSGSIPQILDLYPDLKIVGNKKTRSMLNDYYEIDSDHFIEVGEGDELDLGDRKLTFYLTAMVHWPESMVAYEEATKTLFSQDIFGGFGTLDGGIFDDQIEYDSNYLEETTRYFINIVGKYANQALKALKKLEGLDIELICPDHGPIWRKNPQKIIDIYTSLAKQETIDGCVVIYGSMYGNTETMAEAVARGLAEGGIKNVKVRDITKTSNSYLLSDIWRYKGVILGSCSYDNNLFPPMNYLLTEVSHQRMKNNYWGIFGSYSWSGGALKTLKKYMEEGKYDVLDTQLEIQGAATNEELKQLIDFGKEMAAKILAKED